MHLHSALLLLLAASTAQATPITTNCTNTNYPPCTVALMPVPDQYGSYRVPSAPGVPRWTAFVESLTDNTTYPWANIPVRTGNNDGGQTGGGPNAKGVMWGQPGNDATEVYDCPAGTIALSFDDGPVLTEDYIEALAAQNVIATFFVIGANVVNNPNAAALLKKVDAAGHQIALHTWSHHPVTLWDSDTFVSETVLTAKALYDILGKVPRYWRPPYSALDDRIRYLLHAMGLRPVVWNVESDDTTIAEPAAGIPQSENRQGILSTPNTVFDHVTSSIQAKRDSAWSYFPGYNADGSNSTYVGPDTTYKGFVVLEHEVYSGEEQAMDLIVPWVATQSGLKTTTVNNCDRVVANASMYLPDDHVFVQFIKSITLPLTEDDLNGVGSVFTPSTTGAAVTTSTKTGGAKSLFVFNACALIFMNFDSKIRRLCGGYVCSHTSLAHLLQQQTRPSGRLRARLNMRSSLASEIMTGDEVVAFDDSFWPHASDRLCNASLIQAASNGDFDALCAALNSSRDAIHSAADLVQTINARDTDGLNAILHAACWGHDRIVAVLVDSGANVDILDMKGWTPLMWACSNGHVRTVEVLVAAGAKVDVKSHTGKSIWDIVKHTPNKEDILPLLGANPFPIEASPTVRDSVLMDSAGTFLMSIPEPKLILQQNQTDQMLFGDFDWRTCKLDQMIVFNESNLDQVLSLAFSFLHPSNPQHPTVLTANIVFMCARYAHHMNPSEVLDRFFGACLPKIETFVHQADSDFDLMLWITNCHHLLYYLKRDESLRNASYEHQAVITEMLCDAYERLARILEDRFLSALETDIVNYIPPGADAVQMESILGVFKGSGKRHNNIMRRTGGILSSIGGARIASAISTSKNNRASPKHAPQPPTLRSRMNRLFSQPPSPSPLSPLNSPSETTIAKMNRYLFTPPSSPSPSTPTSTSSTSTVSSTSHCPQDFIEMLNLTITALASAHVHASITKQLVTQLLRAVNARLFNRILASQDLACRSRAGHMLANLAVLTDWTLSTEVAATDATATVHLDHARQLLRFLRDLTARAADLADYLGLAAACPALTAAHVRRAMCVYRFEVGEVGFAPEVEDFVVREWNEAVAAAVARVAAMDGSADDISAADSEEKPKKGRKVDMGEFLPEGTVVGLHVPMSMDGTGYVEGMAVQPVVPSEVLYLLSD
ncbi:hypothetical protein HDU82_008220 [Entophlyctis luteolus]|nr:hypothetical protein HDU82_008220 [Entophlyctis luteolus]KAJ3389136.1 hypothetical protein HDU84_009140 [Entophlyctis sp. JEL0112]